MHARTYCGGFFFVVVKHAVGSPFTGFIGCSTQTQLPRSMWDLLRPGIEPMSPALMDAYPGKGHLLVLILDTVPLDLGVVVLGSQTLHAPDSMQV